MSTHDAVSAREGARREDGQFGTRPLSEAGDVDLDAAVADGAGWSDVFLTDVPENIEPREIERGKWSLDSSQPPSTTENGIVRQSIMLGGEPSRRVRNKAAAEIYADLADPGIVDHVLDDAESKNGKVSLLMTSRTGDIEVHEGTLREYQGKTVLLNKGSKVNGFELKRERVIDATPGYGGAPGLAQTWHRRKAQNTPAVSPIASFDAVPLDSEETRGEDATVAEVYMLDHPGFGEGEVSGALFFAVDRQVDEKGQTEALNGYFWTPETDQLTSEHGSFTPAEIQRWGGKVEGYETGSMKFSECFDSIPDSRSEAYRRITGRSYDAPPF